MKKLKGFTLIEIVMVVTLLGLSIGLVMSWTMSSLDRAELQSSTESVISIIRKQQTAAMNSRNNLPHGIRFESNQFTSFEGVDYASSSPITRQVFSLPSNIHITDISLVSGLNDMTFHKASGETGESGSLTITHDKTSETFTITVNPHGLSDWQ